MESLGLRDPLSMAELEEGAMRNMALLATDETGLDNVWPLSDPRQYLNRNLQCTLIQASVWDATWKIYGIASAGKAASYSLVSGVQDVYLMAPQSEIFVLNGRLENLAFLMVPNILTNTEGLKVLK